MGLSFTPYVLPLAAAAAICALLALYAWRQRRARGAPAFALLMSGAAVWGLTSALQVAGTDLPTKLLWTKAQYFGIVLVPLGWLLFALQYTGRERWLTRRRLALLASVPAATLLLVLTNEAHGLFLGDVALPGDPILGLVLSHGLAFWVHIAYSYLLMFAGSVLLLLRLARSPDLYRGQAAAVLTGVAIPWAINVRFLFGGTHPVPQDPTPFALALSGAAFGWGLFRFGLLDIVPVARDAVIEGMVDGMMVLDAEDRVVDLNPAARAVLGPEQAGAIGRPAAEVLTGWPELVSGARDAGHGQVEVSVGAGPARRHYDVRISPLADRRGRVTGRLVVWRDITARKLAEEERHELERLREDLTHAMVHDLRNPLTTISGVLELLELAASASLPSGQREMLGMAQAGARRMTDLIDAILDVSRLESGRMPLDRQRIAMRPLVDEALELQRLKAGHKRLRLESEVCDGLPPAWADPALVGRVLQNLLGNAVKFTPEGGTIRVKADVDPSEPPMLRMAVSDSGSGLPAALRGRLFQKFATGGQRGEGSGLGLAFCRLAVEAHGGRIWANEPGGGATFTFTLPVSM